MKTAYPQTQATCSIRLYCNIPFDNTYQHHSLISEVFKYGGTKLYSGTSSNGPAKERFINRLKAGTTERYYPRYDLQGEYNFNFKNGLIGSVTLNLTPEQTNANYMRLTCGSDVYYYFITSIQQENFETYTLTLELDVLMTYQDEFLEGMKDVPVFTNRKHCHRYNSYGYPHCADYKAGDTTFGDIKPSVIVGKYDLDLEQDANLDGMLWAYVCLDEDIPYSTETPNTFLSMYKYKGVNHPLAMVCFPFKFPEGIDIIKLNFNDDSLFVSYGRSSLDILISGLVNDGKIHGVKISPYPPFKDADATFTKVGNELHIKSPHMLNYTAYYAWENERTELRRLRGNISTEALVIKEEYDSTFIHKVLDLDNDFHTEEPSVLQPRKLEPKLLFKPFRKYKVLGPYTDGNEFYPELMYSDGVFDTASFYFHTIATSYIGDNNFSTFLQPITDENNETYFNYYTEDNIGAVSNANYVIPSGTNALDVFNSTQAQAFYQSKTASGISSGLTIIGGIGSIGLGVAGMVGSFGMSTPASLGLIAGGVTAVGSGIASASNNIKSANAKIEDLKNTPDSINVGGNSFTTDYGRTGRLLPYVLVYECTSVVKERANDYFYNYGYEVARDCYFNDELEYDNNISNVTDNNLFGRTIFNYIKLNEDITNKINANIPHIIKQKLSSLFNNGITLWSFIRFGSLWTSTEYETGTYNVDKWFMKHNLDNTEYKVS